jgi:peptide/nickel transport system substrate-binding protein
MLARHKNNGRCLMSWFKAATMALAMALSPAEASAQQTTLRIGIASADAGVLDPHLNSSTPGRGFLQQIFSGPGATAPRRAQPREH